MDPFGLDDNASVGSLAQTDVESAYGSQSKARDGDDEDDDSSPEADVKRRGRVISRLKWVLLSLLIVGGIFLSVAAYLTSDEGSAGAKAGVVGAIAFLQLVAFLWYDHLVDRRNAIVLEMAHSSRAIVDQLFPNFARQRLLQMGGHGSSHHGSENGDILEEMKLTQQANNGDVDWKKLTKLNTLHNQRMAQEGRSIERGKNKNGPTQIKTFLSSGLAGMPMATGVGGIDSEPIAELFPQTTVMFADIAGFTSWSSEREPSQVFRLLEKVYGAFDSMAEKLKVFKVETIGDSYMCVTGLPEPDEQHAVNMSRFAYQCLVKMDEVTHELSDVLGLGTRELQMRIGLHSGAVTAGVLRGQKSRFQLFGDTVNTASRMESTGARGRIQVSESTSNLLIEAGKRHWIQERGDRVVAKGKGELRTFWLEPRRRDSNDGMDYDRVYEQAQIPTSPATPVTPSYPMTPGTPLSGSMDDQAIALRRLKLNLQEKKVPSTGESITLANMNVRLKSNYRVATEERYERLIESNTDILLKYIQAVLASRDPAIPSSKTNLREVNHDAETHELPPPFESVTDVVMLPDFVSKLGNGRKTAKAVQDDESIDLDVLRADLRLYVAEIASLYQDVPFHNFEHASHVTLAMDKLIGKMTNDEKYTDLELYLLTFGISADPLTQFAMVLASLIHDVGHSGITNAQLVAEEADVAVKYREKSVAEQNALCVSWAILMHSRHKRLRSHLYKTNVERKRFRQVLINAVMATDIADRDVILARARKWKRAFQEDDDDAEGGVEAGRGGGNNLALRKDERNRRATVVIEALMQVADVAPTMQHWSIWRRWNQKLFEEMYAGYMNGRASFDPTAIWLRGELAFFDYFVIPLAQKIDDCGVFGPSGDQYLEYAIANRDGWEQHGKEELLEMIESARMIEPDMNSSRLLQSYSSGFGDTRDEGTQEDSQSQDVATFAGSSIDFGFDQHTEHSDIDSTFKTVTSEFTKMHASSKGELEEIYQELGNPPPPPFSSPDKGDSRAMSRQLSAKLSSRSLAHVARDRSGAGTMPEPEPPSPPNPNPPPSVPRLDVESSPSRNRFTAESPTKRSTSTQSTSTSHHRNLSRHSSSAEPPLLPHRQPTAHSASSSSSAAGASSSSSRQRTNVAASGAAAPTAPGPVPASSRAYTMPPAQPPLPPAPPPPARTAADPQQDLDGSFQTHRVSL